MWQSAEAGGQVAAMRTVQHKSVVIRALHWTNGVFIAQLRQLDDYKKHSAYHVDCLGS